MVRSLHYAYGNLQYARGDYNAAEKSYTSARKILETDTPYHVLLTACYYKIACLLLIKNQRDEAL
jgi:TolA-binding protein